MCPQQNHRFAFECIVVDENQIAVGGMRPRQNLARLPGTDVDLHRG